MTVPENTVLVTGANGFVGRTLCGTLVAADRRMRRAVRVSRLGCADAVTVGDVGPDTDWRAALEGVQCVVHLVARTHVLRETASNPLAEYRRVNVAGTLRLARQACAAGVRRLVFVSSIKVNGEATEKPYVEDDPPRPEDAYGISKWEAEQALAAVAAESGLEVVVLRPPLVYGPGVQGNFLRLMNWIAGRVPLPLASTVNRRSLIYVGNLADAVVSAIDTPGAAGRTYLVADDQDVSTPELVRAIAHALGTTARLLPCPTGVLKFGALLTGNRAEYSRLAGSLPVDSAKIRRELGWRPRFSQTQGLAETARWYHSR